MADDKYFSLEIISPERTFYKGEASFVELTTSEGEVGIYKNHVPMTNVIVPGIVTIHEADGIKEAAVHSGFMVILQDSIKIMAEDENRANEAKIRAERRLKEGGAGVDMLRAEAALKRSLTRLHLVGK